MYSISNAKEHTILPRRTHYLSDNATLSRPHEQTVSSQQECEEHSLTRRTITKTKNTHEDEETLARTHTRTSSIRGKRHQFGANERNLNQTNAIWFKTNAIWFKTNTVSPTDAISVCQTKHSDTLVYERDLLHNTDTLSQHERTTRTQICVAQNGTQ